MERQKRRGREQWERIINEQKRSGLSASKYCQKKSIGLASFYRWRRRILKVTAQTTELVNSNDSFFEMKPISVSKMVPIDERPWTITLDLGANLKLTLQRN